MTRCIIWIQYSSGSSTAAFLDLDLTKNIDQQIFDTFGGTETFTYEVKKL
jgi:hypothetical protein